MKTAQITSPKGFHLQLVAQCGPLLLGIKMSNLYIGPVGCEEAIKELFAHSKITTYEIYKDEKRVVFLLYRREELQRYIRGKKVRKALQEMGYGFKGVEENLVDLATSYTRYMKKQGSFPHEIGLFLGYPVEDVLAFISNEGKNFLYTGYWKVYHNLNESLSLFKKYDYAKALLIELVAEGIHLKDFIQEREYNEIKQLAY